MAITHVDRDTFKNYLLSSSELAPVKADRFIKYAAACCNEPCKFCGRYGGLYSAARRDIDSSEKVKSPVMKRILYLFFRNKPSYYFCLNCGKFY